MTTPTIEEPDYGKILQKATIISYLDKQKAIADAATEGPWRNCGKDRGGCQCGKVWSEATDSPIAETTMGDWGDEFPSIRFADGDSQGTIGAKVEAYMDGIVYGNVPEEEGKNNGAFIASTRTSSPIMEKALRLAVSALSRTIDSDEKAVEELKRIGIAEVDTALIEANKEALAEIANLMKS